MVQIAAAENSACFTSVLVYCAVASTPSLGWFRVKPYRGAAEPSYIPQQIRPGGPAIVACVAEDQEQSSPANQARTPIPKLAKDAAEVGSSVRVQPGTARHMAIDEFSINEPIDEDEAVDMPEKSMGASSEFEQQGGAVSDGSGDVSQNDEIYMAGAPGSKSEFGHRAAMLQRGAEGPPEIDPSAPGWVQPSAEPQAKAARERSQRLTRPFVLEFSVSGEGCAARPARYPLTAPAFLMLICTII